MKKSTTKVVAMLLICVFALSFSGVTAEAASGDYLVNRAGSLSAGGTVSGSFSVGLLGKDVTIIAASSGSGSRAMIVNIYKNGTYYGSWDVYNGQSIVLSRPHLAFGTYTYQIINNTGGSIGYALLIYER